MGVRVKEDGESESRLVTRRIGVALSGKITPRESGQTSFWSFLTRESGKPTKGEKQMITENSVGAAPDAKRPSAPGEYREGGEPRPNKGVGKA
jgi:hypothetical protein